MYLEKNRTVNNLEGNSNVFKIDVLCMTCIGRIKAICIKSFYIKTQCVTRKGDSSLYRFYLVACISLYPDLCGAVLTCLVVLRGS